MGNINITITISKTVLTVDANTLAAMIAWVNENVKLKLPSDTSLVVRYSIDP